MLHPKVQNVACKVASVSVILLQMVELSILIHLKLCRDKNVLVFSLLHRLTITEPENQTLEICFTAKATEVSSASIPCIHSSPQTRREDKWARISLLICFVVACFFGTRVIVDCHIPFISFSLHLWCRLLLLY